MTRTPLLVAIALLLSPLAAHAQGAPELVDRPGFDLGLRLGYALPLGSALEGADLSEGASGQIPLQVDALYRVNSQYAVGAYVGYGYAFIKDEECDAGASCSGSVLRLGVEGTIHFPTAGTFVPWVGAGIGYEWLMAKINSSTITLKGLEFVSLQVGGDYRSSPDFSVGPFVMLSVAQYSSASVTDLGSADIPNKAVHEWLQFGVRGTFHL